MNDIHETPAPSLTADTAERIAKVIARSGVASRRDAEKMILAGRVTVNGKKVDSPALDVLPADKVAIDGKPIDAPQETRLWLYYKPLGLVTTEKDEQGRRTIFDEMPEEMPRVLNVGRLDLNSEGLLLLTNDGGLKRRLELPETGWLRKYRVRVNGRPTTETFDPLRRGITIDGEDFQPMEVSLDRQQGANAWLTVGIREGKGFGRQRDFAGSDGDRKPKSFGMKSHRDEGEKKPFARREDGDRKPYAPRDGEKKPYARREDGDRKPYAPRDGEKKPYARREDGDRKPYAPRDGEKKPYARREDGDRKPYAPRDGEKKPFARREDGDRKPYAPRDGEKKPYARREDGDRKPYAPRDGEKKPYARREDGDRKPYAPRDGEKKPFARREDGDRKPYAPRDGAGAKSFGPRGDKPGFKSAGFKSHGGGKPGAKPRSEGFKSHSGGDKRPFGGKPGPKRG